TTGERPKFAVLARLWSRGFDDGQSVAEQIRLTAQFGDSAYPAVVGLRSGTPFAVSGRVSRQVDAGEPVEYSSLLAGSDQRCLVGLAVHRDQPLGQFAEDGHRGWCPTDVGA